MPKPKRMTGGYYGTRNAEFFPELFIERAGAGASFSDITAGTGQFPYRMATERNKPVIDRSARGSRVEPRASGDSIVNVRLVHTWARCPDTLNLGAKISPAKSAANSLSARGASN